MQSTNSKYGLPYLAVCHVTFTSYIYIYIYMWLSVNLKAKMQILLVQKCRNV